MNSFGFFLTTLMVCLKIQGSFGSILFVNSKNPEGQDDEGTLGGVSLANAAQEALNDEESGAISGRSVKSQTNVEHDIRLIEQAIKEVEVENLHREEPDHEERDEEDAEESEFHPIATPVRIATKAAGGLTRAAGDLLNLPNAILGGVL